MLFCNFSITVAVTLIYTIFKEHFPEGKKWFGF